MKSVYIAAAATIAAFIAVPAAAQSLNFEGLDGDRQELVLEYYNGGAGGFGSTGGPNLGISFSNNAIACSVQPSGSCNSAALPTGGNLLFFLGGNAATMNVTGGFRDGFSFFYSAVNNPAFIRVYEGLNATGNLLATLNLATTPSTPSAPECFGTSFCPYVATGIAFSGTARSVDFGGSANQVAFAGITLGSVNPGVPEPATWAMMIGGFGLAGAALRRRGAAKVSFA